MVRKLLLATALGESSVGIAQVVLMTRIIRVGIANAGRVHRIQTVNPHALIGTAAFAIRLKPTSESPSSFFTHYGV